MKKTIPVVLGFFIGVLLGASVVQWQSKRHLPKHHLKHPNLYWAYVQPIDADSGVHLNVKFTVEWTDMESEPPPFMLWHKPDGPCQFVGGARTAPNVALICDGYHPVPVMLEEVSGPYTLGGLPSLSTVKMTKVQQAASADLSPLRGPRG